MAIPRWKDQLGFVGQSDQTSSKNSEFELIKNFLLSNTFFCKLSGTCGRTGYKQICCLRQHLLDTTACGLRMLPPFHHTTPRTPSSPPPTPSHTLQPPSHTLQPPSHTLQPPSTDWTDWTVYFRKLTFSAKTLLPPFFGKHHFSVQQSIEKVSP